MAANHFNYLMAKAIRTKSSIDEIYNTIDNSDFLESANSNELCHYRLTLEILSQLDINELSEEEKYILEKLQNTVNEIIVKCKNKTVTDTEAKFLLYIISNSLRENNNLHSQEVIDLYINNCYLKGKIYFNADELILLNSYMLHFINQVTNYNINLKYVSSYDIDSQACINQNGDKLEMYVNQDIYRYLSQLDFISKEDYYYMIVYQAYCLLHEFCHGMQIESVAQSKNNSDRERFEKEFAIIKNDREFYKRYKTNFKIEQSAETFATKHVRSLLKNFIPTDIVEDNFNRLALDIKEAYKGKIPEKEFELLLNDQYDKINADNINVSQK